MLAREVAQAARLKLRIVDSDAPCDPGAAAGPVTGSDAVFDAGETAADARTAGQPGDGRRRHSAGGGTSPSAAAAGTAAAAGAAAAAHPWLPGWGVCQSAVWSMAERAILASIAPISSSGSGGGGDAADADGGIPTGAGAQQQRDTDAPHSAGATATTTTGGRQAATSDAPGGAEQAPPPPGLAAGRRPPTPPTPGTFWTAALPPGLIVASSASPAASPCSTPVARHPPHRHHDQRHQLVSQLHSSFQPSHVDSPCHCCCSGRSHDNCDGSQVAVVSPAQAAAAVAGSPDAVATVRLSGAPGDQQEQQDACCLPGGCSTGSGKGGAAEAEADETAAAVVAAAAAASPSPPSQAAAGFADQAGLPLQLVTPFERQFSVAQRLLSLRINNGGGGRREAPAAGAAASPAAGGGAAAQAMPLRGGQQQLQQLPACCSVEEVEVAVAAALADCCVVGMPTSPEGLCGQHRTLMPRRVPPVPPTPSGLGPKLLALVPSLPQRLPKLLAIPLPARAATTTGGDGDGGSGGGITASGTPASGGAMTAAGDAPGAVRWPAGAAFARGRVTRGGSAAAALSAAKTVATLLSVMPGDVSNIGSLMSAALSFVSSGSGDASGAAAAAAVSALAEDGEAACEACTLGTMAAAATAMGVKLQQPPPPPPPIRTVDSGVGAGPQLSTLASWSGSLVTQVVCALADMLAGPEAAPSARLLLRSRVRALVAGASVAWTAANVAGLAAALLHSDFSHNPATATKTALDLLLSAPSVAEAAKDLIRIGVVVGLAAGGNLPQSGDS
ncbi:hypothetical protein HXX76_010194 [Chlamydomonas incerta]|uniref:Uncharacterized protein n=1 Tax=Chlamydomonas incerta TaxID=51695 RepID=A0A835T0B6_CHLIN|nr:hypothetical protein HXX76_010194 [Chlamydomonas incerta]|eukprot:KAG2430095.1 hypothetical protein HXX76_010194 [Chlamydomonas incerta]